MFREIVTMFPTLNIDNVSQFKPLSLKTCERLGWYLWAYAKLVTH